MKAMNIATMLCLLAPGAAFHATAQSDVAGAKDEQLLTIAGCVQGSRLKPTRDSAPDPVTEILRASEYVLDGQKEILSRLKKNHDGHFEEITGIVKLHPAVDQPDVRVRTKDLGKKTRITIGNRQGTTSEAALPGPAPARIIVQSFKHVANKCAVK